MKLLSMSIIERIINNFIKEKSIGIIDTPCTWELNKIELKPWSNCANRGNVPAKYTVQHIKLS